MPNLRIVYDNIADRATTLAASTTAGTLAASNMRTEYKSQVHRSTGTSVTYTLTWAANQKIGCVALPVTNLTTTATVRVRMYSDTGGSNLVWDSTVRSVTMQNISALASWSVPFNANSFAYGGFTKVAVWNSNRPTNIRRCVIDLVDSSNPAGYIDCARIVIGDYWEPTFNAENGIQLDIVDTSSTVRTEAGDLVVDRNIQHEAIGLDFTLLPDTDKTDLLRIIKFVGTHKNMLLSVFPESTQDEQDYLIYGKRDNSSVNYFTYSFYKHSLKLTGW